eukprot:CAMPEP_0173172124 /NCGR_PEP_ID=MMETSP1141-20130122/2139_1 /TAXON_ID=483371 /ORGANISM="non described non described, Strain CCMP2298" /LENGTH=79 /DNA_ID=CAMNT_0014094135 /DNA_START=417 /DNA_END=656 /DNA_ORIENTATION=-
MMKSPSAWLASQVTLPRTLSSIDTTLPGGILKRTVWGAFSETFCATRAGSASLHVPSYLGSSPFSSAAAFFASNSSSEQ